MSLCTSQFYSSDDALAQYLWLHYAPSDEAPLLTNAFHWAMEFPARCVHELIAPTRGDPDGRALELGCAVGRSAFELAAHYREVVAVDSSEPFISATMQLQRGESVQYALPIQGELKQPFIASPPPPQQRRRVRFILGDVLDLPESVGSFDAVLSANLLCRIHDPKKLLTRFATLVKPGGVLALTTPSTWKHIFTPRENWLGGFEGATGPLCTLDGLHSVLDPAFALKKRLDMPLLIREHERKFELIIAEGTLWQRSPSA